MSIDRKFDPAEYLSTTKTAPITDVLDWLPQPIHDLLATALVLTYLVIARVITFVIIAAVSVWRVGGADKTLRKYRYSVLILSYMALLLAAYQCNAQPYSLWNLTFFSTLCFLAFGPLSISVGAIAKRAKKATLPKRLERWFSERLRNPVDIKQLEHLVANTIVLVPAWLGIILPQTLTLFTVASFLMVLVRMAGSQETLIHSDVHNHLFRSKHLRNKLDKFCFAVLNWHLQYVIPLLSCRAPFRYGVDHAMMHHVEDNGVFDIQSTIWYDRKSFIDFCRFALRRGVDMVTWVDSYRYFIARGMRKPIKTLIYSQCVWYLFISIIFIWNPYAAILVATLPFLGATPGAISIFLWHGLVDTRNTENVYTNTVNFAAGSNGIHAWHLEHHLHPANHWSTQQNDAEKDKSNYERESSIVYLAHENIRFLFLKAMWTRQFDKLAFLCLPTCEMQRDPSKLAALIEERTAPVNVVDRSRLYCRIDACLGRIVSTFLLPGRFPESSMTNSPAPRTAFNSIE